MLPASRMQSLFIRLNLLQIPGQWVIMSTSAVYFKVFLQSLHYLQNTIMTFILQGDKAALRSSAGQWVGAVCSVAALYVALWLSDVSGELGSASRSQKNEIMQTVAPQAGGQ